MSQSSTPPTVRWEFQPPPGVRFVNELGGGVTVVFEEGREDEMVHILQQELQRNYANTKLIKALAERQKNAGKAVQVATSVQGKSWEPGSLGLDDAGNLVTTEKKE